MINISYRIESISVSNLLEALDDGRIKSWGDLEIGEEVVQGNRDSFVTSIMAGVPILPLVFDGTHNPWKLIDGEMRFSLMWGFYNNKYPITNSVYLPINGQKFFKDLPVFMRRRFLTTSIPCIVLNPATSSAAIPDIIERIKTQFEKR